MQKNLCDVVAVAALVILRDNAIVLHAIYKNLEYILYAENLLIVVFLNKTTLICTRICAVFTLSFPVSILVLKPDACNPAFRFV